jgi:hypothetical protein
LVFWSNSQANFLIFDSSLISSTKSGKVFSGYNSNLVLPTTWQSIGRYDVVDLTRQVLSKLANQLHSEIMEEYNLSNFEKMDNSSRLLLELISDMDELLGASEEFLLGPWLESAKALATTDDEKKLVSSEDLLYVNFSSSY